MIVFFDSSVVLSALISQKGGSAQVISFSEAGLIEGVISKQVIEEITRNLETKFPELLPYFEELIELARLRVVNKVDPILLTKAKKWITHKEDAKILAAAVQVKSDYLLTLNTKHFVKDKKVAIKSGLKIMKPEKWLEMVVSL